ncbi:MAG: hypothetical protein AB2L07_14180 [Thermoanaerobaculaceae bacterium]
MRANRPFVTVMALVGIVWGAVAWAGFTGTDVFLPSVGAKPGVAPAIWYTTVYVHNPNTTAANVTFYLLERQANPSPMSFADTIQPGDTAKYDNAVQLMFSKQTFGAIRLTSNVKVIAGSRIYSQSGELKDSVGQYFAGTPASFAISQGQTTELLGVYGTLPSADSTFRYNYGFVETTGTGSCTVRVRVKDQTGAEVGSKTYTVQQWEQMQKSFKDEFPALTTQNARLTVEVVSGSGKVIAFGSGVANGSQDPATYEMAFRDELLAENASGGGGDITGVTAGAGLNGGGASGDVTVNVGAGEGITVASDTVGIAANGVTTAKLADGAVTSAKVADGTIATADLASGAVTAAKVGTSGGSNGQVLTVTAGGAAWQTVSGGGGGDITGVAAGTGLTGGGTSGDVTLGIASGGVGVNQLANGAVVSAKLGPPITLTASASGSILQVQNNGAGAAIVAEAGANHAFWGKATGSDAAVQGIADGASGWGVQGTHEATDNFGVLASASFGVMGRSFDQAGVWAESSTGNALQAVSRGGTRNRSTVHASNTNSTNGMAGFFENASSYATAHFRNAGSGEVLFLQANGGPFIRAFNNGESDVKFKVDYAGNVTADGGFSSPAADFAEMLPARDGLEPGDVLAISADGRLMRSVEAYQASVVGVCSTKPGFLGGSADDANPAGKVPLALVGVVPVKASAEGGAIRPGDMLVASSTPGHAMRSGDRPPVGRVIGKALTPLATGTGRITMIVILQ